MTSEKSSQITSQVSGKALNGIRVIDLTRGPAGGLASMMLADFGAEVLRVVQRSTPDPLEKLPAAPMWHRGKQCLELDLKNPEELSELHRLCACADVFITTWREAALSQYKLTPAQLELTHPHLVVCHISGFGHQGPLANVPGYEHAVAAAAGRMQLFQGLTDRAGPVFSALQVGVHATAQTAVTGILAALHSGASSAQGRTVRTSLLQGFLAYEQGTMLAEQFAQSHPKAIPAPQPLTAEPPMPSLYYHPAQAADGRWMQFGNLLPHLFDNFLVTTGLIDIVADPDFSPTQMMLPPEKQESFRERMLQTISSRGSNDWMSDLIANGQVVAGVYQTTQQALDDPDLIANGHVFTSEEGRQLGPVGRLQTTPAQPGATRETYSEECSYLNNWLSTPRDLPQQPRSQQLPLAGIKVLEIATIIAAPFGASLLADLGASVTKVEQIGGDPYRGMLSGVGSARVNAGKRSVCVNLKSAEGKKIVLDLAAQADILIHNYRPGVPERLGIDYQAIKSINPNIIYLQCNGYGPDGPGADRPSTHPIPGAALGGVLYQLGYRVPNTPQSIDSLRLWTRRLMRANEVNPDPNTALVVATSAMLGLASRTINGEGQQILVDMFGANAYANHDDFLSYPEKPNRALPDEDLKGLSTTYRLYQCLDNRWVFLAMLHQAEHARFIAALQDIELTMPDQFTPAELEAGDPVLATRLEALFAQQPASVWEALFSKHQIACLQADRWTPDEFWLHSEQATAMALVAPAKHPLWGDYLRHGPMATFDDCRIATGAAPLAGQHNRELLKECGYSDQDIDELINNQVIWSEDSA